MLSNYARENGLNLVLGMDEVGWGSFAGPVVVGAVILPPDFEHELIKDSKKLSDKHKKQAYDIIKENAIAYTVQAGSVKQINKYGVEKAKNIAIEKCLDEILKQVRPQKILMDGTRFPISIDIPYECVTKGDNTYLSIAAAAILAKVDRDDYMSKLHLIHPQYDFCSSKGYFCKKHGEGLLEHGKSPYHRDKYVDTWLKKQKNSV